MIRYALTCDQNHQFDSWFQSAAAFDRLQAAGHLACALCGSAKVSKALMAPALRAAEGEAASPPAPTPLQQPVSDLEQALAAMRRQIEDQSDYVGLNFAAEARAMHDGDRPMRAIHGEARADEARRLIEDGVPVAPLPFLPRQRQN